MTYHFYQFRIHKAHNNWNELLTSLRIQHSLLYPVVYHTICVPWRFWVPLHYNDVIMSVKAFQITSLTIVYSTVYSSTDLRKRQSFASLSFLRGILYSVRWIPRTQGQSRGECFPLWRNMQKWTSVYSPILLTKWYIKAPHKLIIINLLTRNCLCLINRCL